MVKQGVDSVSSVVLVSVATISLLVYSNIQFTRKRHALVQVVHVYKCNVCQYVLLYKQPVFHGADVEGGNI